MKKLILNLNTITPIGNFVEFTKYPFVCYKGYLFFVNLQKLESILSLVQQLFQFYEFYNTSYDKNITQWLKIHGFLRIEFLEEISMYKMKYKKEEEIKGVYRFFQNNNCYYAKNILNRNFSNLIKATLKNIILYEYFQNNYIEFNQYVSDLISFLKNNSKIITSLSLNFYIKSIFEIDRQKLTNIMQQLDEMIISVEFKSTSLGEIFSFEKIYENSQLTLRECIKAGLDIQIKIILPDENYFYKHWEKYLTIAQNIASEYLSNKKEYFEQNFAETEIIKKANFCFFTSCQMFYLNLTKNNNGELNKNLQKLYGEIFDSQIFYFDLNNYNQLEYFNQAYITVNQ